jgi:cobalt-zinc-cadmium efflux system protein
VGALWWNSPMGPLSGQGAHDHPGPGPDADVRALTVTLVLISTFLVVEAAVGFAVSSLALLADAGHMLIDATGLVAAVGAARLARRPPGGIWTFGFLRAEVVSAAFNGVTLLVVAAVLGVEAVNRLVSPVATGGGAMVVVAAVGVGVNLVATWFLAGAARTNLNVEGAFRHILTDLFGFGATAVAGAVILATGFDRADPIASLAVVAVMAWTGVRLLGASGRVLLEAAPEDIDLAEVRAHLLGTEHVVDVHDLHVWAVSSGLPALSAHVVVGEGSFEAGRAPRILDQLQACVAGHFDVEHSTFQLEPDAHREHEPGSHR